MINVYLNLNIFTVFLKNKDIIFKIRRSKVTDYAALTAIYLYTCSGCEKKASQINLDNKETE